MAFTVDDFQDLLHVLEQHPEWRDELRRRMLSDDFLALPGIARQQAEALTALTGRVDQLTERMDQLTERMDQLAERMDQLTGRMDQLAERMDQLTERMDQLTERMDQLTERMDQLTERMDQLTERMDQLTERMDQLVEAQIRTEARLGALFDRVGTMDGDMLELRFARRAPSYLSRLARRLRVIDQGPLADLLDDAVEDGRLTQQEREAALLTDVVLSGMRREDSAEAYFVVEVSAGIGTSDVQRAVERARILAKLGQPAVPVVAGRWINDDASAMARSNSVAAVLDGKTAPPDSASH